MLQETSVLIQSKNMLANDYDPKGDEQVFIGFTCLNEEGEKQTYLPGDSVAIYREANKKAGSLQIKANGDYIFIPEPNFVGTLPVVYTIEDDGVMKARAEANLYLSSIPAVDAKEDINQTPSTKRIYGYPLHNDEYMAKINFATYEFKQGEITVYPGRTITVMGVNIDNQEVQAGSFAISSSGYYIFTPASNFVGTVNPIYYTAQDESGAKDEGEINIKVLPVVNDVYNQAPIARDDRVVTGKNLVIKGNLLNNDIDPDGHPIKLTQIIGYSLIFD